MCARKYDGVGWSSFEAACDPVLTSLLFSIGISATGSYDSSRESMESELPMVSETGLRPSLERFLAMSTKSGSDEPNGNLLGMSRYSFDTHPAAEKVWESFLSIIDTAAARKSSDP